jgi:hypothetical protein
MPRKVASKKKKLDIKKKTRRVNRDAGTGEFVSDKYAAENKSTTVRETIEINQDGRSDPGDCDDRDE